MLQSDRDLVRSLVAIYNQWRVGPRGLMPMRVLTDDWLANGFTHRQFARAVELGTTWGVFEPAQVRSGAALRRRRVMVPLRPKARGLGRKLLGAGRATQRLLSGSFGLPVS